MMIDDVLLEAIAVTAELTGTELSDGAARVMAADLAEYPTAQILAALTRCRREIRTRLTVADVVARIEDGRPGPEEAWAHVFPLLCDQGATIVWTEEERVAYFKCENTEGDRVAARVAFLESYRKLVLEARNAHRPVNWIPTLGWRTNDREGALREAVTLGRITHQHAVGLLPHTSMPAPEVTRLMQGIPAAHLNAGQKEKRMAGEKEKDPSDEPQPKPGDEQREAA